MEEQGQKQPLTNMPLPPKPIKPSIYECCNRGCSPCIFDYYKQELRAWKQAEREFQKHKQIT